ncbi:MAG: response regulator [Myxococcales bacterium]
MKPKVLVVDDSPTIRAQVVELLSEEFECVQAVNGADGLRKIREQRPHAVVADLEMPEMDGIGLLRSLRADPVLSSTPVIILTTVTAVTQVNECRSLGCAGFVLKPPEKAYLLAKLRQLTRAAA